METKKNEFEEMDAFVNMLINEGAKKGSQFYVNLKNRDKEKRETNIEKIKNLLQ